MFFHILTLFPDYFPSPLKQGLIGKAFDKKILKYKTYYLRDYAINKYGQVDDTSYGGGPGLVLRPEPAFECLEKIKKQRKKVIPVIYFTPRGKKLTQKQAWKFAKLKEIVLICGRYEGIDQRIIDQWVDYEISIGDYILNGGEAAALVFIETVGRLLPGVVGKTASLKEESFSYKFKGKKEYPLYTKPAEYRGLKVPKVLLSGHHANIERWKKHHLK